MYQGDEGVFYSVRCLRGRNGLSKKSEQIIDDSLLIADNLFRESAEFFVRSQQGSTSLLQRKYKIGYERATQIIEQLEAAGIIGPFVGSKSREVLINNEISFTNLISLTYLLNDLEKMKKIFRNYDQL